MLKKVIIVFLLSLCFISQAQNLVLNPSVSSPEIWPFEISVKTLILNNHNHEKITIYRDTDCLDSQTV
jgi:hypothetical protein